MSSSRDKSDYLKIKLNADHIIWAVNDLIRHISYEENNFGGMDWDQLFQRYMQKYSGYIIKVLEIYMQEKKCY